MTCLAKLSLGRTLRILLVCGVAQLIVAVPALGKGARGDSRKAREDAARVACSAGDVTKGIEILAELYAETRNSVFVHNQGRCYQENGLPDRAIPRFEEHLRKATDLTAEERTTVERYISECQAKIDNAAAPKAVIQPSIVQATPAADTVQTSPMVPPPPSSEIGNPGRGMRIGGIVTAVVGVVALGAGVGFNLAERSLHNQMTSDVSKNTSSNENRRSTYQVGSIVGYTVGAAAVVTGTVLYVLGARDDAAAENHVSLMVDFVPGTASLGLKGRF
jgi:hypothetical protein